jgi:uncharacterized protein YjlB
MWIQDVKAAAEKVTGYRRPDTVMPRTRKPHLFRFDDDGRTPNNPRFPMILYRSPVRLDPAYDPAAIFEVLFAAQGWGSSWRDGIFDFNHFHTGTHEVLGIARGQVKVKFGGDAGRVLQLKAGDVVIVPAGTGHRRLSASRNLLVVGAYPDKGRYDQPSPGEVDHDKAVRAIARVGVPDRDPVYGSKGGLLKAWNSKKPAG